MIPKITQAVEATRTVGDTLARHKIRDVKTPPDYVPVSVSRQALCSYFLFEGHINTIDVNLEAEMGE